jgi:hypothetical protein
LQYQPKLRPRRQLKHRPRPAEQTAEAITKGARSAGSCRSSRSRAGEQVEAPEVVHFLF